MELVCEIEPIDAACLEKVERATSPEDFFGEQRLAHLVDEAEISGRADAPYSRACTTDRCGAQ